MIFGISVRFADRFRAEEERRVFNLAGTRVGVLGIFGAKWYQGRRCAPTLRSGLEPASGFWELGIFRVDG